MSKYPWPPESTAAEIIRWMRANNADSCVAIVNVCDGIRLGCLVGSLSGMLVGSLSGMVVYRFYDAPGFYLLGLIAAASLHIPREWLLQAAYSFREWLAR